MITLTELFQAYYDCRKNKRNSCNSIWFEIDYESKLIELYNEIIDKRYRIWKSTTFIVHDPVKREIFAADFRDRIVHHLLVNELNPFLEKKFIFDSYSCRVLKWTSFWIKRISQFIRAWSDNYSKDCYILKLDIQGFFMNINKTILMQKLVSFVNRYFDQEKKEWLLYLLEVTVFNDPTKDCIIKWSKRDWIWLPKSKSIFYSKENTWLPVWNLTSQVFANLYLHEFDTYVKKNLKIRYYGRYVDDFVLIHEDKNYLKDVVGQIRNFLYERLLLDLHPKKIYLQHYSKWVHFLWAYIKPYRTYVGNRTKWNFYKAIQEINAYFDKWNLDISLHDIILSRINSYLWFLGQYNTYKLRKKMLLEHINWYFWNYFYISNEYRKICKRKKQYYG